MDAQAKKKALFRAKLNAQKKEKRIDSPLVRYNEFDQPVCRVCDVVLKSESSWDAHQVSRKHHEAINNIKANAAGVTRTNTVKPESFAEPTAQKMKVETLKNWSQPQASSGLPPNFFDNHETVRQKNGTESVRMVDTDSDKKPVHAENRLPSANVMQTRKGQPGMEHVQTSKQVAASEPKQVKAAIPEGFFHNKAELPASGIKPPKELAQGSIQTAGSETKQVKGALPEGFFDNKEADLRARGIKPVKPDVKDEYKEFEKLIQEDLKEVDNRLEEEEFDAAEMIEEEELVEQKSYKEKVEILKRKKIELVAARSAKRNRGSQVSGREPTDEESSSDDDSDGNFAVDWRAQHL